MVSLFNTLLADLQFKRKIIRKPDWTNYRLLNFLWGGGSQGITSGRGGAKGQDLKIAKT